MKEVTMGRLAPYLFGMHPHGLPERPLCGPKDRGVRI
jgi:hypothetical protein